MFFSTMNYVILSIFTFAWFAVTFALNKNNTDKLYGLTYEVPDEVGIRQSQKEGWACVNKSSELINLTAKYKKDCDVPADSLTGCDPEDVKKLAKYFHLTFVIQNDCFANKTDREYDIGEDSDATRDAFNVKLEEYNGAECFGILTRMDKLWEAEALKSCTLYNRCRGKKGSYLEPKIKKVESLFAKYSMKLMACSKVTK